VPLLSDLFANAAPHAATFPLTVFRAAFLSHGPATWVQP